MPQSDWLQFEAIGISPQWLALIPEPGQSLKGSPKETLKVLTFVNP